VKDFSTISQDYENTALVQKSASDILLELLDIQETDDILDLGCGPGHLTKKIRERTRGKIIGIDSAEGMIRKAKEVYCEDGIEFRHCEAGQIDFHEEFDVIFCNSAFQWFKPPGRILKKCFQALKKNGKIGIQAPAKHTYSPNFIKAVEQVHLDSRTKNIFAHFHSPWFFLETSDEYKSLFEASGFIVHHSQIDKVMSFHTPEETYKIFDSGASAGYLNQNYYEVQLTEEYISAFQQIIKEAFKRQANKEGKVELIFYRIYLVAEKP